MASISSISGSTSTVKIRIAASLDCLVCAQFSISALRGQRQDSALHPRFFCKKIE